MLTYIDNKHHIHPHRFRHFYRFARCTHRRCNKYRPRCHWCRYKGSWETERCLEMTVLKHEKPTNQSQEDHPSAILWMTILTHLSSQRIVWNILSAGGEEEAPEGKEGAKDPHFYVVSRRRLMRDGIRLHQPKSVWL